MASDVSRFAFLTRLAFRLAAVLAAARAMTSTYVRDVLPVLPLAPGELAPADGAGASTVVVLNTLCLLPAVLVLMRWMLDAGFRLSRSWSVVALAVLATWAFVSHVWSSDQYFTAIAASDWLAAAALIFAFASTARAWADLRLCAALAAGVLCVNIASGAYYVLVDHPQTVEDFMANLDQNLADRGIEPGSFRALQFLGRLERGEYGGFAASSNSYAATLGMLSLVTAGLAWSRLRTGPEKPWGWIIALALLPAAYLMWRTGSRTALAAVVLATIALIVGWRLRGWLADHRRLALATIGGIVIVGIVCVIGYGMTFGTLPHVSMRFRWNYWLGAAGVFGESPIFGVGFGNFGDYFLTHRPAAAAEEVADPHNLFVRFFTETGIIGGALAVMWVVLLALETTRPIDAARSAELEARPAAGPRSTRGVVILGAAALALSFLAGVDLNAPPSFVTLELLKRFLFGMVLLLALFLGAATNRENPSPLGIPAPALAAAMLAAIAGIFLHAMVDVVLFEPAVLMSFVLVVGPLIGLRAGDGRAPPNYIRAGVAGVVTIALLGFVALLIVPVMLAERAAARGDGLIRNSQFAAASEAFLAASERAPAGNVDFLMRAADAMYQAGDAGRAMRLYELAAETNPRDPGPLMRLAALHEQRNELAAAAKALGDAVTLNPQEMSLRLRLADLYEALNRPGEAAEQRKAALDTNAAMAADEPERLDADTVRRIEAQIRP